MEACILGQGKGKLVANKCTNEEWFDFSLRWARISVNAVDKGIFCCWGLLFQICLMGFCSFILLLHQFWSISKVKYNIFNPNYLRIYCKSDKWVSKIWWPSCRPQDVYIMLAAKISLVAEKSVWIGFWVTQWGDLTWFENWLFVN